MDSCIIMKPELINSFRKWRYALLSETVSVGRSNMINTLICLKPISIEPDSRYIAIIYCFEDTLYIDGNGVFNTLGCIVDYYLIIKETQYLNLILMCQFILLFQLQYDGIHKWSERFHQVRSKIKLIEDIVME